MMKWFTSVSTMEEAKKLYRELVMKYHPDRQGGNNEIMAEINAEYEKLMDGQFNEKKEATQSYMNVVVEVIKYDVNVENIGSWLWVSGRKTYEVKDELKGLGFQWSNGRKMWYFSEGLSKKRKGSEVATDVLRLIYGSKMIKEEAKQRQLN